MKTRIPESTKLAILQALQRNPPPTHRQLEAEFGVSSWTITEVKRQAGQLGKAGGHGEATSGASAGTDSTAQSARPGTPTSATTPPIQAPAPGAGSSTSGGAAPTPPANPTAQATAHGRDGMQEFQPAPTAHQPRTDRAGTAQGTAQTDRARGAHAARTTAQGENDARRARGAQTAQEPRTAHRAGGDSARLGACAACGARWELEAGEELLECPECHHVLDAVNEPYTCGACYGRFVLEADEPMPAACPHCGVSF